MGETQRRTSDLDRFRELLSAHMAKKGLRSTDPRRLIVETFFTSPNPVSIDELLAQVRPPAPTLGYAPACPPQPGHRSEPVGAPVLPVRGRVLA